MPYHYLIPDFAPMVTDTDCEPGDPALPLDGSDTLTRSVAALRGEGWMIYPLLNPAEFDELKERLTRHIKNRLLEHGPVSEGFTLEKYHEAVADDATHYAISSWAMLPDVLGPLYETIKGRVEALLHQKLALKEIEHRHEKGTFLGFRIVRPGKTDHSPIHRDAWLPYWRNTMNIWLPVCGFGEGNTMHLLPKTHLLSDADILKTKQGASINGRVYHVPAAIALKHPFEQTKPYLDAGEALFFSPYLLHGNGANGLPDTTRISIELRFCAV